MYIKVYVLFNIDCITTNDEQTLPEEGLAVFADLLHHYQQSSEQQQQQQQGKSEQRQKLAPLSLCLFTTQQRLPQGNSTRLIINSNKLAYSAFIVVVVVVVVIVIVIVIVNCSLKATTTTTTSHRTGGVGYNASPWNRQTNGQPSPLLPSSKQHRRSHAARPT
eukprot:scaffold25842_cov198-Amphora_coffeaeformis.AAC.27